MSCFSFELFNKEKVINISKNKSSRSNLDEEQDGVDGSESNGTNPIQFEFSTETTYAAQKGIR